MSKNINGFIAADSFAAAPKRWEVIITFAGTLLIAAVAIPWYGWYHGFDAFTWGMFALFFSLNNLSITTGYHRLWSHKTFKANIIVRLLLALGGAFALQNSILKWASDHRRHHLYVDDNTKDPYSAKRGFWFSHMGWMLKDYPSAPLDFSNVKDLMKDPIVRFQHRFYLRLGVTLNIGIPLLIGVLHGDILGALILVGFLRLVAGHHTTFLINSLAHMWGTQPYSKKTTARDNPVIALLTFGEGYHNFHHTFPGDFRNAVRWWQWDPTKWLIRALWAVGLTRDLRRTPLERIQKRAAALRYAEAPRPMSSVSASEKAELLRVPASGEAAIEEEPLRCSRGRQCSCTWQFSRRPSADSCAASRSTHPSSFFPGGTEAAQIRRET